MTGDARELIEMQLDQATAETQKMTRTKEYKAQQATETAKMCREWRAAAGLTASRAAEVLGIPARTYEGIEQGRGFAYPHLLALAIQAFR